MLVKYIDRSGNIAQLETLVDTNWESKLIKCGRDYYEKPEVLVWQSTESVSSPRTVEASNFDEVAAKEFLKSKGVRWYGLLKWESLKRKALEEWFIIN